jgi:hypothetical protein
MNILFNWKFYKYIFILQFQTPCLNLCKVLILLFFNKLHHFFLHNIWEKMKVISHGSNVVEGL